MSAFIRCNYCPMEARTVVRWSVRVSSRGHRKTLHIKAAACPSHETCVNFVANRGLHPDARVEVNASVKPCPHYEDNQGLCHQCGVLLNRDSWEFYAGKGAPAPGDEKR